MIQQSRSVFDAAAGLLAVLAIVLSIGLARAEEDPLDAESIAQVQEIIATRVTLNWLRPDEESVVDPRIRISLNRDGSLDGAPEIENPSDDPAFKAFAVSALRAIYRAAPFDLAEHDNTYEQWKSVVMTFSSK